MVQLDRAQQQLRVVGLESPAPGVTSGIRAAGAKKDISLDNFTVSAMSSML